MKNAILPASLFCLFALPAIAQVVNFTTPNNSGNYIAVIGPGPGIACGNAGCVQVNQGIPLGAYATTDSVNSQIAGVTTQVTGVSSQVNALTSQVGSLSSQVGILSMQTSASTAQLNNVAARADAQYRQNVSFAAAVGAMRDAIPNDGDRFAVRFNTAAVGGAVAGGFSASANFDEKVRASFNYGSSSGESVVSGGLNFSIH